MTDNVIRTSQTRQLLIKIIPVKFIKLLIFDLADADLCTLYFNIVFIHFQIVSCERGMGTRANSTYMPYVITTDETIQRQILCDTKTEGGGWIVIQVGLDSNDNEIKTVFNRPVL